jgi:hypothetical protein
VLPERLESMTAWKIEEHGCTMPENMSKRRSRLLVGQNQRRDNASGPHGSTQDVQDVPASSCLLIIPAYFVGANLMS